MSSFLDACGATGPMQWAVGRRDSAEVSRLAFDLPYLVIGRDPGSDLQLRHPEVSGRHAYLQLVGGRLFCVDLGSRTGIYIDGRCVRSGWVGEGETIRIGPYRLRLVGGGRRGRSVLGEPDASDDPDGASLSLGLSHRSIRSSSCPLAAGMTLIGSADDCAARLLDPSVSDYHCSLIQTPKGIWAVDLLGRGGTSINGAVARLGRVYEGDELRVGGSSVRLGTEGPDAGCSGSDDLLAPAPGTDLAVESPARALVAAADFRPLLAELSPEKAELVGSVLVPLVQQFGLMQQQMFDRQQQSDRERARAFAEYQHEQFGALHEELDQLRELRQEIDELRAELRAQGRPPSARERAAAARPRLGSAAPQAGGAPALEPPEGPKVLRMAVGEAS